MMLDKFGWKHGLLDFCKAFHFDALAFLHGSLREATDVQEEGGFIFCDIANRKYFGQIVALCRTRSGWMGASEENYSVRSVKERCCYCCCCGAEGTGVFVS